MMGIFDRLITQGINLAPPRGVSEGKSLGTRLTQGVSKKEILSNSNYLQFILLI